MAKYVINKEVILQESWDSFRGDLQSIGLMKYDEKDGYKTNHDGSAVHHYPGGVPEALKTKAPGTMGTMEDYETHLKHAGEITPYNH